MWRDLFSLSRREQSAFLVVFIGVLLLVGLLLIRSAHKEVMLDPELYAWIESVELKHIEQVNEKQYECFNFDPNTVKVKEMERLGFSKTAIINIIKYREAGGHIKTTQKFGEIYGVDSVLFNRLKSNVVIEDRVADYRRINKALEKEGSFLIDLNNVDSTTLVSWNVDVQIIKDILQKQNDFYFKNRVNKSYLLNVYTVWQESIDTLLIKRNPKGVNQKKYQIEINSADTAMLALLRGVGPAFSKRIVSYRNRIGGFYQIQQLQEVKGISPVVIEDNLNVLFVDTTLIVPLNLSKASLRQMKEHPYLNFYMAKAIYESRKKGELHSIQQFFSVEAFANIDEELFKRYFIVSN